MSTREDLALDGLKCYWIIIYCNITSIYEAMDVRSADGWETPALNELKRQGIIRDLLLLLLLLLLLK